MTAGGGAIEKPLFAVSGLVVGDLSTNAVRKLRAHAEMGRHEG